jgi:hypothetical protein
MNAFVHEIAQSVDEYPDENVPGNSQVPDGRQHYQCGNRGPQHDKQHGHPIPPAVQLVQFANDGSLLPG